MTTIQVRTEDQLKKQAQRVLSELGLDLSSAINMYLHQIVLTEGIPFPVRTANGFTPAQEKAILKEVAWAKKHGKRYSSASELHRNILGK
ncbi:MAG: type II toxin-antitoxin system RelB/DinJ family antitoxin [Candidatus Peregrinibacteria bacterium]|nr:type II toxin-antitoxin system RelB/DinJ family antitoxin [Candidatus Peregrinibacteria bacterium]